MYTGFSVPLFPKLNYKFKTINFELNRESTSKLHGLRFVEFPF